jgi:hypothetical protein
MKNVILLVLIFFTTASNAVVNYPTPGGIIPTEVLGPSSNYPRDFNPRNMPSATSIVTTPTSSGVNATVSGKSQITLPSGRIVQLPVSSTAHIPRSAIANAAKKAARALPGIGTALVLRDIYQELKDTGMPLCADQQDFCKPDASAPPTTTPNQYYIDDESKGRFPTAQAACEQNMKNWDVKEPGYVPHTFAYISGTQCFGNVPGYVQAFGYGTYGLQTGCATNYAYNGTSCVYQGATSPGTKYTEAELEQAMLDKLNSDPAFSKRYYDAMRRDLERNRYSIPETDMVPPSTPVIQTGTPVTGPKEVVGTKQIQNSDGTTSTVQREAQTTITPVTSGSTVSDASTRYQSTTTITTTTTNNTTNVTTVETEDITDNARDECEGSQKVGCKELGEAPPAEKVPSQDIPVAYSPITFSSSASCPTPIQFNLGFYGGAKAISWEPFCDVMGQLRAIFLACAAAACAWIFVKGMSTI